MKVFISWSGERSKRTGEIFRDYLKCIIQSCDPFFSSEIDKGVRWFSEISKELENSDAGIICLTRENFNEPWILFEAGALSKSLDRSRVCIFLLDLEPTDLTSPLAQFQATKNIKEDILKLFMTINALLEKPLGESVLKTTFDTFWPKFEKEMKTIPKDIKKSQSPVRDDRDLLEEILEIVREQTLREHSPTDIFLEPMHQFGVTIVTVVPEMRETVSDIILKQNAFTIYRIIKPDDRKNIIEVYFRYDPNLSQIMSLNKIEGVLFVESQESFKKIRREDTPVF